MRFIKKISVNKYKIFIDIKSKYIVNKNRLIFFGNPVFYDLNIINLKNINNYIHQISGYFLCLSIKNNKIIIYNDIAGNFRVYYRNEKNKLFITDNFKRLFFKNKLVLDKDQFEFWNKKNYTTGSRTLFKEINKIPPASRTEFFKNKIKHSIYFNSDKIIGKNSFKIDLHNNLEKNFQILKNTKKKNILLFSGGKDSSLLAQFFLKEKINFISVFINTNQKITEIEKNKKIASSIAKKNNFEFDEIKIDLTNKNKSLIINYMMFDFHFSLIHFEGIKKIIKKYGKNINLICGQSSDSIFSYGASANTFSHFISRLSYFYNNRFISFVVKIFLERKYNKKLINYNINKETLFFLSFYYYLYIDKDLYQKSKNIIKEITNLKQKLRNKRDYFMYLKIFGFLQGSDNQVVINACKAYDVNCFLPYLDPQIIYSTVKKKNSLKDIFFPKYVVNELLDKSFKNIIINYKHYNKTKFLIKDKEKELKNEFLKIINKLKAK